jgi:hypothetical protein
MKTLTGAFLKESENKVTIELHLKTSLTSIKKTLLHKNFTFEFQCYIYKLIIIVTPAEAGVHHSTYTMFAIIYRFQLPLE